MFVNVGIQHTMRMRHVFICDLSGSNFFFFCILSHVVVLVNCVLVFTVFCFVCTLFCFLCTVFCFVCTVFWYCFVYVYLFLFVLSVLV
jgi:hypothetical protein